MLKARTLVRQLSGSHVSSSCGALLHSIRSAACTAKQQAVDESLMQLIMTEPAGNGDSRRHGSGAGSSATQAGRQQTASRKRYKAGTASSLPDPATSSVATEASKQDQGHMRTMRPHGTGSGRPGPVIEDNAHPLRAGNVPLITLRILSRLRRAGEACALLAAVASPSPAGPATCDIVMRLPASAKQ